MFLWQINKLYSPNKHGRQANGKKSEKNELLSSRTKLFDILNTCANYRASAAIYKTFI